MAGHSSPCSKPTSASCNENNMITFNDLPGRSSPMKWWIEKPAHRAGSVNNAKAVDTHVPMSVDEAAEHLPSPERFTVPMEPSYQARQTLPTVMNWTSGWSLVRIVPYPMRNLASPYPLPTVASSTNATGRCYGRDKITTNSDPWRSRTSNLVQS